MKTTHLARISRARRWPLDMSMLLFILVAFLAAACGGNGDKQEITPTQDDPAIGNKDKIAIAGILSIDEQRIEARLDANSKLLTVDVPMLKEQGGDLTGTLRVTVTTLEGDSVVTGDAPFSLSQDEGLASVTMDGADLPDSGEEEALYLVKYGVEWDDHELSGVRSLFFAQPKFDLRTRFPNALFAEKGASVRVFTIDPTRNAPLADVDVSLVMLPKLADGSFGPAVAELTARTDAFGSAVFDVPEQDQGEYVLLATTTSSEGAIMGQVEDDISVIRTARVLVTTDKPMYKPGQRMEIRALVLNKPDLHADADQDLTFEIYDGKGNMVFRKYEKTNAFGIASTRFQIASQVNMGDYEIRATLGEGDTATATSKTVPVTYYALPKFKIDASLDKAFYIAGDKLHGVLNVRYFFGKAVAGGSVDVIASAFDIGFSEFATVTGFTNDEGIFDFEIDLPGYLVGQDLEGGNAMVTLEVNVTDTAMHLEKKVLSLVVAKDALNLVAIPESGELVPGLENAVYLFASDPLGQPADVSFSVDLGEASGENKPDVHVIGAGIGKFVVTPAAGETLSFTASASDETGTHVSESFSFDPGKSSDGLLLTTDRALYRVGETAKVRVFATNDQGRIFLDLIKDGQTALTQAFDIANGAGGFDLDLDGSLVGDLIIEAYMVTGDAAIVRDKKMIFVKDAKGLNISITPSQDQYLPGEEATIDFDVTDTGGNAAVAALGVQIVDEAVYALTEMRPGLLETWFLIEEALQQPKYEIHGASFNMTSLVTADPDDEEQQTVAGAAFAALDTSSFGGNERSSWSDALSRLPAKLKPYYDEHVKQVQASAISLIENGYWTWDTVGEELETQQIFYDFWGNLYRFEAPDNWNITIRSFGPDELEDTSDDWSSTVSVDRYSHDDGEWGEAMNNANGGAPQAGGFGGQDAATSADTAPPGDPNAKNDDDGDQPRVRKDFPETLYWNPSLITDEEGKATVSLTMADSITEWRVTSVGNTSGGVLGSNTTGITVFQDFFVDIDFPAILTRKDEITFPVAVYNYLPITQTVTVEIEPSDWFSLFGSGSVALEVDPGEVTVVHFPVRVEEAGWHALTVTGIGSTMSDAIQRMVLVKPDGKEFRDTASGMLKDGDTVQAAYPASMIPNSHELLVKIYPGIMAQAVEGLDSMLQMPSGCFEQTTATNWPNTLITDYLRQSGQINPEIELKAVNFLQQGYQRLLTYECTGGGFVWFGDPSPANVILSAMGVMEFADMSKVIEIDEAVIARTVDWLLSAQKSDGSWHTNQGSEFATVQYDDPKTTAYVSWALGESGQAPSATGLANDWLETYAYADDTDTYALSLIAAAYSASEPDSPRASHVFGRLADLAVEDEGLVYWTFAGGNSWGGGGGSSDGGNIEVTAYIIQALMRAGSHMDLVGGAVAWLASNKDSFGNWGTTHATIQSLRAMIMSLQNKTEEGEGITEIYVNGALADSLAITEENRNVFHQFELGALADVSADNDVLIEYEGTGNLMYQVVWSWFEGYNEETIASSDILSIELSYDKTQLQVDDVVTAKATVTNLSEAQLDMVMVDLGLPPGFTLLADKLAALVESQQIMKYELPGQQISIYLEKLLPGQVLEIEYDLQAKYPVKAQSTGSSTYLYYDTETKDEAAPVEFEVDE